MYWWYCNGIYNYRFVQMTRFNVIRAIWSTGQRSQSKVEGWWNWNGRCHTHLRHANVNSHECVRLFRGYNANLRPGWSNTGWLLNRKSFAGFLKHSPLLRGYAADVTLSKAKYLSRQSFLTCLGNVWQTQRLDRKYPFIIYSIETWKWRIFSKTGISTNVYRRMSLHSHSDGVID